MMYEKKKKKPIKATLGVIIIVFVSVGIFVSDYYREHYYTPPSLSQAATEPTFKTLDVTPQQYGERLNTEVDGTNLQRDDWNAITIDKNTTPHSFVMTYTNDLILTATVHDNGELIKLHYAESAAPKTNEQNVPLMDLATAVGRTLHPKATERHINKQIKNLVTQAGINYSKTKTPQRNSIELEGNIYTFEISNDGLAFVIEPAPSEHIDSK